MPAKPLTNISSTFYKVETNFPNTDKDDSKFGSFYVYSYTDVRDPGADRSKWLVNTQKELFDKRSATPYGGKGENLSFDNLDDAMAVAEFLKKYGRITAGWDNSSQLEYQKKRRGPLKVRVVQEYSRLDRRLIVELETEPTSNYEIELAALKKKYGVE